MGEASATAFARVAWGHEFERERKASLSLLGLPGVAFAVEGARPKADVVLASAGMAVALSPWLSLRARFDGEFADGQALYAGSAKLAANW